MTFYIHDIFNDEREDMDQIARAVQNVIDTSKLYVTCMLPGEELCVNYNSVAGYVISYDPESRTYSCEFSDTPAGSMITDWGRVYDGIEFNGHPQVCYGAGDTVIVTQVILGHECG